MENINGKPYVKIKLWRTGAVVFGQLLEQRGIKRGGFFWCSSKGIEISSSVCPQLTGGNNPVLYLIGSRSDLDNRSLGYTCESESSAENYIARLEEAIKELNGGISYRNNFYRRT